MSENALKETVIRLAEPVVRSLGLVIWGVEVVQAGRMVVRLFVDVPFGAPESLQAADGEENEANAPSSASIGQCEEISRHLGLALEVEDAVPSAYVLEVSTPGLTRLFFSLDQMRPYLGDMVEARLHVPVAPETAAGPADCGGAAPRRLWRGKLAAVEADAFVLEPAALSPEGEVSPEDLPPVRLPWTAVRRASRMYIFRQLVKPGKGSGKGSRKNPGKSAGPVPAHGEASPEAK